MSRSHKVATVRRILAVRLVQQRAAEMAVHRAAAREARLNEARSQAEGALTTDCEAWAKVLSQSSMNITLARTWSASVQAQQARLGQLDVQILDAEQDRARREGDWRAADNRSDVARSLLDEVSRRARRRQDEAGVSQLADRVLQGRARP